MRAVPSAVLPLVLACVVRLLVKWPRLEYEYGWLARKVLLAALSPKLSLCTLGCFCQTFNDAWQPRRSGGDAFEVGALLESVDGVSQLRCTPAPRPARLTGRGFLPQMYLCVIMTAVCTLCTIVWMTWHSYTCPRRGTALLAPVVHSSWM